jgi:hypothetical protein
MKEKGEDGPARGDAGSDASPDGLTELKIIFRLDHIQLRQVEYRLDEARQFAILRS